MRNLKTMNISKLLALTVLALPLAGHVLAAETTHNRLIDIDDLYRLDSLSEPQVSPDGLWVAYLATSSDRAADAERTTLYMVSWDGRQRLALTAPAEDIEKPRFSPDGRYLSYIETGAGERGQLMLLDRRGGEPLPLRGAAGVTDYSWASDGKRIALIMEPEEHAAQPKPIVIDAIHFKQDGEGYLGEGSGRHLYLAEVETMKLQALTRDAHFNEDTPAFSPDGAHIAFTQTHEKGSDQDGQCDLEMIDVSAGAAARKLARVFVPNSQSLTFSPDGKWVAYLQGREPKLNAYMQDRLFIIPSAGGEPKALTEKLDRAVMSYAFDSGATIAAAVEDDASVYPVRIELASGSIDAPKAPPPFVVSGIVSAAGHTAMLRTDDASFAEVYAWENGQLRALTSHNAALLSELKLAAVEPRSFKSGGVEVHSLLVKPPGFDPAKKYPLLLWIHGGPNGHDEHSLTLDGYQFEPQIFAAKGYLVLRVNYRGGSGRGMSYASTIMADWGHKEVQDLLAGVDYEVAHGNADPKRLAVGGWSYGGLLTDYTIASDRRFKAAICGAGSGNQIATYGSDEYVMQYNAELGPPWVNTSLWLKVSYPFFHADRIHTPTLFLGGQNDFNVPIIGGEQMYESLRTLGVPARLIVYPGEHHVFTRPSFVVDLEARMSAWLGEYIH
jgi:dipeptidyl aminopeptidase/acylaminoacyl peptidase